MDLHQLTQEIHSLPNVGADGELPDALDEAHSLERDLLLYDIHAARQYAGLLSFPDPNDPAWSLLQAIMNRLDSARARAERIAGL